jgi:hypothetical protein
MSKKIIPAHQEPNPGYPVCNLVTTLSYSATVDLMIKKKVKIKTHLAEQLPGIQ